VAVRIEGARVDLMARGREWRGSGWEGRSRGGDVRPARLHVWRPAGRGDGRVRGYAPADDGGDDDRTVGDPEADPMRLSRSHPARHGGL
jgi:hypothetical protein